MILLNVKVKRRFGSQARAISIVTCPSRMGHPCRRERLCITSVSNRSLIWASPDTAKEMHEDLPSLVREEGLFFVGVGGGHIRWARQRAVDSGPPHTSCPKARDLQWVTSTRYLLPPCTKPRFSKYLGKGDLSESFLCDLSQDGGTGRGGSGSWVPTLAQSSVICS